MGSQRVRHDLATEQQQQPPHQTEAEAEASMLWPPDAKNGLIRKDPDAGKD